MAIIIDIEVSQADPPDWMVPDVNTMDPPGNMTKASTIDAWRAEKASTIVDDLRAESSLHTILHGFIACVGIAVDDKPITVLTNATLDEVGELAMLRKLERGLLQYPADPLVTYNGAAYDYVWLRHRAIRHGLFGLARRVWQSKPWETRCIDLYLLWCGGGRGTRGKLPEVARFLGVEVTNNTTGKDVQRLLDAGDIEAVKAHCADDVRITREVFRVMAAAGWVEKEDPDNYAPLVPAPLRQTTRQLISEAMVELSPALIQDAAGAAGIPWQAAPEVGEARPLLEAASPPELRRFLGELRARRVAA